MRITLFYSRNNGVPICPEYCLPYEGMPKGDETADTLEEAIALSQQFCKTARITHPWHSRGYYYCLVEDEGRVLEVREDDLLWRE